MGEVANELLLCLQHCKKSTTFFVCMSMIMKKVSNVKIEKGGEGLFTDLNDYSGKTFLGFLTLYSTLLYSTTTKLQTNYYLTTTFRANCTKSTTFLAGVMV